MFDATLRVDKQNPIITPSDRFIGQQEDPARPRQSAGVGLSISVRANERVGLAGK